MATAAHNRRWTDRPNRKESELLFGEQCFYWPAPNCYHRDLVWVRHFGPSLFADGLAGRETSGPSLGPTPLVRGVRFHHWKGRLHKFARWLAFWKRGVPLITGAEMEISDNVVAGGIVTALTGFFAWLFRMAAKAAVDQFSKSIDAHARVMESLGAKVDRLSVEVQDVRLEMADFRARLKHVEGIK